MNYELEHFTDFLVNPSAPEINEFFRMLQLWCKYIEAHTNEFNYLEDDEWKEIRERLIDEADIRFDIKDELFEEFEDINDECERMLMEDHKDGIKLGYRRLKFMKTYNYVFKISDEDIASLEKTLSEYAKCLRDAYHKELELRGIEYDKEQSLIRLDESLAEYYEKTGRLVALPHDLRKKTNKGN